MLKNCEQCDIQYEDGEPECDHEIGRYWVGPEGDVVFVYQSEASEQAAFISDNDLWCNSYCPKCGRKLSHA